MMNPHLAKRMELNEVPTLAKIFVGKYNYRHFANTSTHNVDLAKEFEVNERVAEVMGWLHDLAKVTPKYRKLAGFRGTFTDAMRKMMADHTVVSAAMISSFSWIVEFVSNLTEEEIAWVEFISEHHHIRKDEEVNALDIPEELRTLLKIMIIVDNFDAIMSERPEHPARTLEETFAEMENPRFAPQFDQTIYAHFKSMLTEEGNVQTV